ncbi:hypothetical protein CkaCkLH20_04462 [Colletotrichum karsti]|uniref:Uncharacterized protein n=1 Tax=Colletotrichum karsti TaxID=1095194 RepID=A0A9P6I9Y5_9PEZI|nr:uncharacterized protein CkaCkLH20_04462 [Colletotrichum karsti]KAF9877886.1 hypothetical protein CkaCkLH20_04462 [Colletotrichum karsti]
MPELENVGYSHEATISDIRKYYQYLVSMYLDDSMVVEPPEGGWPHITTETAKDLGKSDEVIKLLRHLPYICRPDDGRDMAQGVPGGYFADWAAEIKIAGEERNGFKIVRQLSESSSLAGKVPPHVIGLTMGARDTPIFLLDTELGVVYWYECPGEIRHDSEYEQIEDDPYDYAPEEEAEWRAEGGNWAIPDFFEELKAHFRELHFVPVNSREVKDIWTIFHPSEKASLEMIRGIYREHHWPDLKKFDKSKCQQALQAAFPDNF